jgi:uncharacterized RDD family membrane protein YckC
VREAGYFCSACGAHVEPNAERIDPRVAGFVIRALARLVDTLVEMLSSIAAVKIAVVLAVLQGRPGGPQDWLRPIPALSAAGLAGAILCGVAYHAVSEYVGAASLGKLCFGVRVVSRDFGRVSLLGALVRSFAILVDGFFFGVFAYMAMERSPLRQRLGDRWGETLVVRASFVPEARRGAFRTGAGILLGFALATAIGTYSVVMRMAIGHTI